MRLLACGIFKNEFDHLVANDQEVKALAEKAGEPEWLPAGLHPHLDKLEERFKGFVAAEDGPRLLYASCHPDVDALLEPCGGRRLPGRDCIDAFIDRETRDKLEGERAMVISMGWLRDWRKVFKESMGWDEADALANFGFYDKIFLLDFGIEPIDDMAVLEFFDYSQKPVEIVEADLGRFKSHLMDLLGERNCR